MAAIKKYAYIDSELIDDEIRPVLGEIPKRWGRMDPLSRLAVVEVGRLLLGALLLDNSTHKLPADCLAGLVVATRYGSLTTDLAFAATMAADQDTASPMLFGYTLPNIALAEAASQYGLRGPVYSIFADSGLDARTEAARWLADKKELSFMVAGELDIPPDAANPATNAPKTDEQKITARFEIIYKP